MIFVMRIFIFKIRLTLLRSHRYHLSHKINFTIRTLVLRELNLGLGVRAMTEFSKVPEANVDAGPNTIAATSGGTHPGFLPALEGGPWPHVSLCSPSTPFQLFSNKGPSHQLGPLLAGRSGAKEAGDDNWPSGGKKPGIFLTVFCAPFTDRGANARPKHQMLFHQRTVAALEF